MPRLGKRHHRVCLIWFDKYVLQTDVWLEVASNPLFWLDANIDPKWYPNFTRRSRHLVSAFKEWIYAHGAEVLAECLAAAPEEAPLPSPVMFSSPSFFFISSSSHSPRPLSYGLSVSLISPVRVESRSLHTVTCGIYPMSGAVAS